MANVKVFFQKKVKGHGQGNKFKIYGTVRKVLSSGSHMPNIKYLSQMVKSYGKC